jgi:adenosine deaminase
MDDGWGTGGMNPKMFGNTIAEEYRTLGTVFEFTPAEIRRVMANSIKASWKDPEKKKRRLSAFPGASGSGVV